MSNSTRENIEKQKALLEQLKSDIDKLDYEIKHAKRTNLKVGTIRRLKINLRFLQLILPYVVTAGITSGFFVFLGDIPFYRNDTKDYLELMAEGDSNRNIRYVSQYDSFDSRSDILYLYSEWVKEEEPFLGEDNIYSRTVKTFDISISTYEELLELFDMECASVEDILGKPSSTVTERKNNLTEEEMAEGAFFEARAYIVDTSEYIVRKQSVGDNIFLSSMYILLTLLAEIIPAKFREQVSSFNYSYCVDKIREKYPDIDVKELKRKLEIKQNNYNRLTRQ